MREITMYLCEICNEIHNSPDDAEKCESRGKEIPIKNIHEVIEYEIIVAGGFDSFHIPLRIGKIKNDGHYVIYTLEEYDEVNEDWCEFTTVFGNQELMDKIKIRGSSCELCEGTGVLEIDDPNIHMALTTCDCTKSEDMEVDLNNFEDY